MGTPQLALLKVWKSSLHRNLHSHDRNNRCHSWTLAESRVLLAWLLLHVPVLFLGQHSKNLQVTVMVPWGVCRLDLCLTGVKNSFYILVTSSEVTDRVQIHHTFKVRIFRAWEERGYCTMQQEKQHITLLAGQGTHFWQPSLWHQAENFPVISCSPLCISSPHFSSHSILCPWPTHRAQNKCTWAPLAGFHSCATNTEMLQAVAHWKQSREYSAPMEDILFWSEADISKNPQFVPK